MYSTGKYDYERLKNNCPYVERELFRKIKSRFQRHECLNTTRENHIVVGQRTLLVNNIIKREMEAFSRMH